MGMKRCPFVAQHDGMDCGPACLSMVSMYYGKKHSLQHFREMAYLTREGVSLLGLTLAAESVGFETCATRNTIADLKLKMSPVILFWKACHFVVLYSVRKSRFKSGLIFRIGDPSKGIVDIHEREFIENWCDSNGEGICLILEPTDRFFSNADNSIKDHTLRLLADKLRPHIRLFAKLALCLGIGAITSLILPFLTKAVIDEGVAVKSTSIVLLIILAELAVMGGALFIDVVRNWMVLYIGTRINIDIITDYFEKITKLPIKFFDTKFNGDFYQRINDHTRVELFLTSQTLTTLFSFACFIAMFTVLFKFNALILLVYISLTLLSVLWSNHFLNKREELDYLKFRINAQNQEAVNELINGIHELKLNDFENFKINKWKKLQIESFDTNVRGLRIDQYQLSGFDFINQIKNLIITFITATMVIDDKLTMGGLISVSFIIGQLNSPISQFVAFFRSLQDAKLSMKRLNEVQTMENEGASCLRDIETPHSSIFLNHVSFSYEGPLSPKILNNITCQIPKGKVTAIVGPSGSGKSTLLKLLLNFYSPTEGNIMIGETPLKNIHPSDWRRNCGVVMQDGYIFSETIERNIICNKDFDPIRFDKAIDATNLKDFINSYPLKEKTIIGAQGNGISGGEKQRVLIARALYKDPRYLFLDEASSSLDTVNEHIIQNYLRNFFKGRTVVVIAHRLSTIKNADNILVLRNGQIVESGSHSSLMENKKDYYRLINNQLV